jgi:hypothetical protein
MISSFDMAYRNREAAIMAWREARADIVGEPCRAKKDRLKAELQTKRPPEGGTTNERPPEGGTTNEKTA